MIQIQEVAFVGYPVTDMKRAFGFYEGLLGLKRARLFGSEDEGFAEYDIGAVTLSIGNMAGDQWKPSTHGGCVALEVTNFHGAVEELKAAQVPVKFGPMETPVCFMLGVLDPDGNTVMLHQRKPGHA